jgi:hypothetical protein
MEFKMDTSDSNIRIEPAQRIKRPPPCLFRQLNANLRGEIAGFKVLFYTASNEGPVAGVNLLKQF